MSRLRSAVALLFLLVVVSCGDPAKEMPRLLNQLKSSDSKDKSRAALELGRIGSPAANRAVPLIIPLLDDPNAGVRSAAAYALRSIGGKDAERALDKNRHWGGK